MLRPEIYRKGAGTSPTKPVRSDYHTGTTWAPVGETPVVEATGACFSLNMISAVSPSGEMRFRLVEGSVTGPVFADFLEHLARDAGRKVFLTVDGHPSHRSRVVQRKLKELNGQVELFFQPLCSPEPNPDEPVWSHVKRRIGGSVVVSMDDLKQRIISAFIEVDAAQSHVLLPASSMPLRLMIRLY